MDGGRAGRGQDRRAGGDDLPGRGVRRAGACDADRPDRHGADPVEPAGAGCGAGDPPAGRGARARGDRDAAVRGGRPAPPPAWRRRCWSRSAWRRGRRPSCDGASRTPGSTSRSRPAAIPSTSGPTPPPATGGCSTPSSGPSSSVWPAERASRRGSRRGSHGAQAPPPRSDDVGKGNRRPGAHDVLQAQLAAEGGAGGRAPDPRARLRPAARPRGPGPPAGAGQRGRVHEADRHPRHPAAAVLGRADVRAERPAGRRARPRAGRGHAGRTTRPHQDLEPRRDDRVFGRSQPDRPLVLRRSRPRASPRRSRARRTPR